MRLYLKNIGMIKEADVKLNGLTLIAGENDTGKSTVGKIAFSIIKSVQKFENELLETKEYYLERLVRKLYYLIRENIDMKEYNTFRKVFPIPSFLFAKRILRKNIEESILYINEIESFLLEEFDLKHVEKEIREIFIKMKDIIQNNMEENNLRKQAFKKLLLSEFNYQVSNTDNLSGIIKVKEKQNDILEINLLKNDINEYIFKGDLSFEDVIYIESPIVLSLQDSIRKSIVAFEKIEEKSKPFVLEKPVVAFHYKDLINKLDFAVEYADSQLDDLTSKIKGLIRGEFKGDVSGRKKVIFFEKENVRFDILNVATGIKSFGIIQLLINGGFINKNTLLIIDEPEVHLHPKWQIEYAKLIVELVKRGIKVLITSHSPFFIEAVEILSKDINRNFYLAKQDGIIKETSVSEIYDLLSESIDTLEDMEIESKKW